MSAFAINPATFGDWAVVHLQVVPWRLLHDGTQLMAPRFKEAPILINLSTGEDDWVTVPRRGFNYSAVLRHQSACDTTCVKVLLQLPAETAQQLQPLDGQIQRAAMTREVSRAFNWKPMVIEDCVLASIVLDESDAPTELSFLRGETVCSGRGGTFFKEQLGDASLEDFCCKAIIELQFVDCDRERKMMFVAAKVHSIALVEAPREKVVKYTAGELEDFARAAKRLKVRRL